MLNIPRKYQVDENGNKTAVLLDIEVFNKIVEILENNGLKHLVVENQDEDIVHCKSGGVYNKLG